jgi:ketosteroid isomerase-like protein
MLQVGSPTPAIGRRINPYEYRCEIVAKYVTDELAYVVQLAHEKAKVGGSEILSPIELRNTMILRPEGGTWKIVHLHGDPITVPRPAESVIRH